MVERGSGYPLSGCSISAAGFIKMDWRLRYTVLRPPGNEIQRQLSNSGVSPVQMYFQYFSPRKNYYSTKDNR